MTAGLCLSSREAGAQNVRKFDPIKEDLKDRYGIIVDEDVTVSQVEIGAKPFNSMYIANMAQSRSITNSTKAKTANIPKLGHRSLRRPVVHQAAKSSLRIASRK